MFHKSSVAAPALTAVFVLLGALTLSAFRSNPAAQSQANLAEFVPGEILIKFKPQSSVEDNLNVRSMLNAERLREFRSGAEHWKLGPNETPLQVIQDLRSNANIEYVEPNYVLTLDYTTCTPSADGDCPVDPNFPEQWALRNVNQAGCTDDADTDATEAWTVAKGGGLVALIDSGAALSHPDLSARIWSNPNEIANNEIDDDGCGQIDDIHGYDFEDEDANPDDPNIGVHGTEMAGLIAAKTDNIICYGASCPEEGDFVGVAGMSWYSDLMIVRGFSTVADAVQSIDYVTCIDERVQRVDVINASWGGYGYSQTLRDAIQGAGERDILFVTSAGNSNLDLDVSGNERYPASYDLPNILTVAMTDCNDHLNYPTNYGTLSVDLAAPGENNRTTGGYNAVLERWGFVLTGGTSAAAAHTSGVAALVRSLKGDIPGELIKKRIVDTVDALDPNQQGFTASDGRLNAYNAVDNQDTVSPTAITDLSGTAGDRSLMLQWTSTGDDGTTGASALYEVRFSTSSITSGNWLDAARAWNEPEPDPNAGVTESMTLSGLSMWTTYYVALKAYDEWGNADLSNVITCQTGGLCTTHYCIQLGEEYYKSCTWTGGYGGTCDACCAYSCTITESCSGPTQAPNACQP